MLCDDVHLFCLFDIVVVPKEKFFIVMEQNWLLSTNGLEYKCADKQHNGPEETGYQIEVKKIWV